MIKYAEIFNKETMQCNVGLGTDIEFYQSIGMTEMDVEESYDNKWYLKGYAPQQPLEELKQAKILELQNARDEEELSPIFYEGNMWDFDDKAQQRINGAIVALEDGGELTWTSADNTEIENVDIDVLRGVVKAAAVRSNEIHIKYRTLKTQIEKAKTLKTVNSINWQ